MPYFCSIYSSLLNFSFCFCCFALCCVHLRLALAAVPSVSQVVEKLLYKTMSDPYSLSFKLGRIFCKKFKV